MIVDNRDGAGGVLGTEIAATSEPVGHTLPIISVAYAFNPALYKLRFDPEKAFVPVALLGAGPNALTVSPKLPANSVKELIAVAKAQPGKLNYASAGVGSFHHCIGRKHRRHVDDRRIRASLFYRLLDRVEDRH